ncbi:HNH endonuclease [Serratia sp. (in: enterobacteria)]|uniref:HNH endonuclease n=1 Tax=Serratia sp. (in: enterobacteria) TaxID=616 RepID=UPI00398A4FA5
MISNWENQCAITGTRLALEAAHILSHASGGNASAENGICLAADLHTLLDSGHLLILNGTLRLSDEAKGDLLYAALEVHYATNTSRKSPFPGTLTT